MRVWVSEGSPSEVAVPVAAGEGLFEAVKVVDGRPFALGRHLARLGRAARTLGLPEVDETSVRRGVAAVLAEEELPLGRLRITYTGGVTPVLTVTADSMAAWDGPTAVITAPYPRNDRSPLVGLKSTAYVDNLLALVEARRRGAGEAVFANLSGHLCEGTASNVFYVVDGELRTPTVDSGCLDGVTRALVLEWYGAREVDEPLEAVAAQASEVFLASTTRDVQGVSRWDDHELEAPGPVTSAVQALWKRREPELLGL